MAQMWPGSADPGFNHFLSSIFNGLPAPLPWLIVARA
jgi:hypothetical protein